MVCSFVSVYHDEPAICGGAGALSAAALPDMAGSCPKWLQREIDQVCSGIASTTMYWDSI